MSVPPVYFDYNATTPLDPAVREAMLPFLDTIWGNPSSVHQIGRRARALLDDARDRVATVLGAKPSEVVFTSGGTESNNLAIFGTARHLRAKGRHLITTTIEHHAVLQCFQYLERYEGFTVTYVPVDAAGQVPVSAVERALRPDTTLVSVMAANNELGTLQPVAAIGALCRTRGVVFHTDAVQVFGKLAFTGIGQFNADLVSICAHKFHGPKGAGALYIRSPLLPDPILFGGAHENERRAGTENLPAIIGFTEATARFLRTPVFPSPTMWTLTRRLHELIAPLPGVTIRGSQADRLPNTLALSVQGCDSIVLMAGLDMEGICASSGSACSAGSLEPSHVLLALGVPATEANALIRFSLGRDSTAEEVERAGRVLPQIIARIRGSEWSG
ncbi:cysteine desulfurase [Verrucomicrobiota bacterium]|nr:cysteine desulfurase [Verrucomicrobiota bacterium]